MFIFNVLRNISLLFVLAFIALLFYLENNKEAADKLEAAIERYEKVEEIPYAELPEGEEAVFGSFATEVSKQNNFSKIKIKTVKGLAYLRPSQIMYVKNTRNELELATVDDVRIYPKYRIGELKTLLCQSSNFFATKRDIMNVHYLLEIQRAKDGRGTAIMTDGTDIPISKDKRKELEKLMEEQ